MPARSIFLVGIAAVCLLGTIAPRVEASCNIIPGTARAFRGVLGWIDRPFAEPGAWVEVSLDSACHAASPGLSSDPLDHSITIVFDPPSAAKTIAVITDDCAARSAELDTCASSFSVADVVCIDAVDSGPEANVEIIERAGIRSLRFRFPDTDISIDGSNDDRTATGATRIAVTEHTAALACSLSGTECAAQTGLVACVDEFYATNGTCNSVPHEEFSQFTALPPANDYQELCSWPAPPCLASADELRMTIDRDGNILVPMKWDGILISNAQEPIATMLRGSTTIEPFSGQGGTIELPSSAFLSSFAPEGALLPPILQPQTDADAGDAATVFGSADAPYTILRIARRSTTYSECSAGPRAGLTCEEDSDCPGSACIASSCQDGSNQGLLCSSDADCPGSECGPSLFDLSDRLRAERGPVLISRHLQPGSIDTGLCEGQGALGMSCSSNSDCPVNSNCVGFSMETQDAVTLDGIITSDDVLALVASESIAGEDLNGDADLDDDVIILRDATAGVAQPLGVTGHCASPAGSTGRAVATAPLPPFSVPAVSVHADIAGFLETESDENACDSTLDGDTDDAVLRVYQIGVGERTQASSAALAADTTPLINGAPIAATAAGVYFRHDDGTLARFDPTSGVAEAACVAAQAEVTDSLAAFLRPESDTGSAGCVAGSLNSDADTADLAAYRWQGSTVENLGRAAISVAASESWIVALIDEADEGTGGTDLNADGDMTDTVVALHSGSGPAGTWVDVAVAAEDIDIESTLSTFLISEADQSATDHNGDGDANDKVLGLYDAASNTYTSLGQAAIEYVLGASLIALRTAESAQATDLNGDLDQSDNVLQVYDRASGILLNTGQTAIPCNQTACNPRTPYQALDATVRFLTDEALQLEDLNKDGDRDDVVLQIFNVAMALANSTTNQQAGTTAAVSARRTTTVLGKVHAGEITTVGAIADSAQIARLLSSSDGSVSFANGEDGIVTAADSDGDELPDPFDNCPQVSNVTQRDRDQDGVGDACEPLCGDGVIQSPEECDGQTFCDSTCAVVACGDPSARGAASVRNALLILDAAAGLSSCDACVCDLNGSGAVTVVDAQASLQRSIGLPVPLACSQCSLEATAISAAY